MTSSTSAEMPTSSLDAGRRAPDVTVEIETPTSFEGFYLAHRDAVARAVAVAIGDGDLAAEATDEAMIRAYQRWSRIGALERPAGWVFRVAVNHSRSRLRRVARKARYVGALDVDRHDDAPFAQDITDAMLQQALQRLDRDQRSVVVLRVLLEFSERECATALDIRPGTAKSRLHRGLAELRAAVPHLAPHIDALETVTPSTRKPPA